MRGRLGAVPDEPERMLAVAGAAHIGAKERCGGALLLRIPRSAMAGEIGVVDILRRGLSADIHGNAATGLDSFFRLAAIKQVELTETQRALRRQARR